VILRNKQYRKILSFSKWKHEFLFFLAPHSSSQLSYLVVISQLPLPQLNCIRIISRIVSTREIVKPYTQRIAVRYYHSLISFFPFVQNLEKILCNLMLCIKQRLSKDLISVPSIVNIIEEEKNVQYSEYLLRCISNLSVFY